ncbi:MAG TPA: hypothetical protein PKI03_01230 [Pseudomonadota bacterium]|nr:hypothetical protein [Pseudomonadota bacterium]
MQRPLSSQEPSRSAALGAHRPRRLLRLGLGLGLLLAAGVSSCDAPAPTAIGPLVRINLKPLPASASKVSLKVTAAGRDKSADFSTTPLDILGVTFEPGTNGQAVLEVQVFDESGCLIGKGQASISLASDIDYELPITLEEVKFCGMPASKLIVQLVNGADGSGKVTGPGIDCGGGGSDCEEVYRAGTQVTLSASATVGNFIGWTGGCTGVGACSLTLTPAGDFTVQASFGVCRGWCPEPSGIAGTTQRWSAIYGRSTTDIVAVGYNGAITRWDGQSWKSEFSGTTKNLYAITVPRGSTSYVAVGESGTVLGNSGMGWFAIPVNPATTKDLLGVSGVSDTEIRIVGQDATFLRGDLKGFSASETLPSSATTTRELNSIMVQVNNGTSGEFLIAGNTGYTTRRFYIGPGYWDDASPGGTKNLYSAWFSKTRQVAVGEGGLIFRRSYQGLSWQGWTTETSGLTTDLRSVWGASETNIFTVGLNGKILFWDGSNWTPRTTTTTADLYGLWGTSSTNAYAVGTLNTILHYVP